MLVLPLTPAGAAGEGGGGTEVRGLKSLEEGAKGSPALNCDAVLNCDAALNCDDAPEALIQAQAAVLRVVSLLIYKKRRCLVRLRSGGALTTRNAAACAYITKPN
jgi:hypothetical protein